MGALESYTIETFAHLGDINASVITTQTTGNLSLNGIPSKIYASSEFT